MMMMILSPARLPWLFPQPEGEKAEMDWLWYYCLLLLDQSREYGSLNGTVECAKSNRLGLFDWYDNDHLLVPWQTEEGY
jgi:hypothetical protein